jgi:hypothetical protein
VNSANAIAVFVALAALISWWCVIRFSHPGRTREDFPEYAYYRDGYVTPTLGPNRPVLGITLIALWMASLFALVKTGHDYLASTVWAGTVVFLVSVNLQAKLVGRKCKTCGQRVMLFRNRSDDDNNSALAIHYLLVCDDCKEVRSELMAFVTVDVTC